MMHSRRARIVLLVAVCGLATLLFAPLLTYREVASPDGQFVATARTSVFQSLMPAMPGQAGDKPGRISVARSDGRSCGSTPIDMVSMIGELRWELGAKPREASIVATARWNLDACTVEVFDR
jgi:hypothetical protein